jgi:hypothetical protein
MSSAATLPPVHLYQIAYSEATQAGIEPGYLVLDNMSNSRPDWFEYWPIRRHLLNETLDEDAFYGFFSPKFGRKTGLTYAALVEYVQALAHEVDVFLFSPQADMGAFFLNVFEQGELFDAGFIAAANAFLESIGRQAGPTGVQGLIMDSRQIVFSNYFVARPAFWREWLKLTEAMFAICEGPDTPLREQLTCATTYGPNAPRKVFMLERLASYLLVTQPQWRTRAANTFNFAWSASRLNTQPIEAYISDALKIAMREQGYPQYQLAFNEVRRRFMASKPD